jgi:ABC-type antimicrobial peptide transport system permease subunit
MDSLIARLYEHHISPLVTRRNLTDLSAINILAALLLLVVVLNLLSACSAYIDQNMKNIALLKAFGMGNAHIRFVFTAGLFVLEIFGLLIGIGMAYVALAGLNRSYSKPFEYVYQYYWMPPAGYIGVAVLLILMVLGSNFFVFSRINRLSPAQALIYEQ